MNELIKIAVTADVGGFVKGMAQADTAMERFGVSLTGIANLGKSVKQSIDAAFDAAAATGRHLRNIGIGGVLAMAGWGLAASDFESRMRNVNSLVQLGAGEFNNLSGTVLRIGASLPAGINATADAMYNIVSSGFEAEDALTIVQTSAEAASAGLSTTDIAAQALTASLNAYGKGASEVSDVSDILFSTVDAGVLSFEDLAIGMGDWVAMAAAAKVPLEDASAALATITRAGVQPAEASTSVARLLQSFIEPSEALIFQAQRLGYETPNLMLQTLGLKGSMDALRGATGGSAEKMLELFNEVRAARGAFALIANEGKSYADVAGQIIDKNERAGATQKALAAQAEGAGFKFKIMTNNIQAVAIQMGNYFLPAAKQVFDATTSIATEFTKLPGPVKAAAAAITALGTAISLSAGLFLIYGLKTFVMKKALGLVADTLLSTAASASKFGTAGQGLARGLTTVAEAAGGAGGSLTRFATNFVTGGLTRIPFLGPKIASLVSNLKLMAGIGGIAAAGAAGILLMVNHISQARAESEKFVKSITADIGDTNFEQISESVRTLQDEFYKARAIVDRKMEGGFWSDLGNQILGAADILPFYENNLLSAGTTMEAVNKEIEVQNKNFELLASSGRDVTSRVYASMIDQGKNLPANLRITNDQAMALAETLGVDLVEGGRLNEAAAQAVADEWMRLQGITGEPLAMTGSIEEMKQQLEDAEAYVTDFVEGVAEAFAQFDVISQFDTKFFEDEENVFNFGKVEEFYGKALESTSGFLEDINTLIQQGYDPGFIARLLQAGPKEAADFVDRLAADSGGKFTTLINNAEKMLANLQGRAIEMARLVAKATGPGASEQIAKDLPAAQRVQQIKFQKPDISFEQLLKESGLSPADLRRVAQEYDFEIPAPAMKPADVNDAYRKISDFGKNATLALQSVFGTGDAAQPVIENVRLMAEGSMAAWREEVETSDLGGRRLTAKLVGEMSFGEMKGKMKENIRAAVADAGLDPLPEVKLDLLVETQIKDQMTRQLLERGTTDPMVISALVELVGDEDATTKIAALTKTMNLTPEEILTVMTVNEDREGMDAVIDWAAQATFLDKEDITIGFGEDGMAELQGKTAQAQLKLDNLKNTHPHLKITADASGAIRDIDHTADKMNSLDGKTSTVTIRVTTWREEILAGGGSARRAYSSPGRNIVGPANGAILKGFADGGIEDHKPQIVRPGTWRLWAEPETGGEAYIPMGISKRQKAMSVLGTVATEFGFQLMHMANGAAFKNGTKLMRFADGGTLPLSSAEIRRDVGIVQWDEHMARVRAGQFQRTRVFAGAAWAAGGGAKSLEAMAEVGRKFREIEKAAGYAAAAHLARTARNAQEWEEGARRLIESAEKKKQAQLDAQQLQRDIQDNMFKLDKLGTDAYIATLKKRLVGLKQYSNEWTAITEQIKQIEEDRLNEAKQKYQGFFDSFAGPIQQATSLVSALGNQAEVTGSMITGFLEHAVEGSTRWTSALSALAARGLDQNILQQLAEAGPQALQLAEALEGMTDLTGVNAYAAQLAGIQNQFGTNFAKLFGGQASLTQAININVGGLNIQIEGTASGALDTRAIQAELTAALGGAFGTISTQLAQGTH